MLRRRLLWKSTRSVLIREISVISGMGLLLLLTFNYGDFGNLSRRAVDYGDFGNLFLSAPRPPCPSANNRTPLCRRCSCVAPGRFRGCHWTWSDGRPEQNSCLAELALPGRNGHPGIHPGHTAPA